MAQTTTSARCCKVCGSNGSHCGLAGEPVWVRRNTNCLGLQEKGLRKPRRKTPQNGAAAPAVPNLTTVPHIDSEAVVAACSHCGHIFGEVVGGSQADLGLRCVQCNRGVVLTQRAGDARELADSCLTD